MAERTTEVSRFGYSCLALLAACGGVPATRAPDGTSVGDVFGDGTTVCAASRPQFEPDLMGWDSGSRANLSHLHESGVVAVRYRVENCNVELEILPNCIGDGKYLYSAYSSRDTKLARSKEELYAKIPIGAAALAGRLTASRALRADYLLVGLHALPPGSTFRVSQLKGPECSRATHVVSRIYLGGFRMAVGDAHELEAGGSLFGIEARGSRGASLEHLASEGNLGQCEKAQETGQAQPLCNVPLRVGLLPIVDAKGAAPTSSGPIVLDRGPRMRLIPGGTFWMGTKGEDEHRASVREFELDETEVTVAHYRACVADGACTEPAADGRSLGDKQNHCTFAQAGRDNHPINCVDFDQATAFCGWAGKRLPTDDEWEFAARGATRRLYPWGDWEPKAGHANGGLDDGFPGTAPVGSFPGDKSAYGIWDMAANVSEWTSTPFCIGVANTRSFDASCPARAMRGGDFKETNPASFTTTSRSSSGVRTHFATNGFRCAR